MELTADQSNDATEVQLGRPMSLLGVTCRSLGGKSLTKAGMATRQLNHQKPPQYG